MVKKIFTDTFRREQELLQSTSPSGKFDLRTVVIFCYVPIALTIIRYYGDPLFFANVLSDLNCRELADRLRGWVDTDVNAQLHHLGWWIGTMVLCYLIIPCVLIKFLLKEKLNAYGFHLIGALKDGWIYLVMLAVMLPLVYVFSSTASFQHRYPFFNPEKGAPLFPDFLIWELMYLANFVALEFFFRGFMTLGLRHRFGFYSIFIMTIPYCMIHFGKPMPETIGAIFAGIILGTLSMKSRSIFLGIFIHYSIAIAMDLFALWRKDFF